MIGSEKQLALAKELEAHKPAEWKNKILERPKVLQPEPPQLPDSLRPYFQALRDEMLAWLEVDARNSSPQDPGMGLGTTRAGLYRALSQKLLWEIDSRANKNHAPSEQIILPDLVRKVQNGRPGFEEMIALLAWEATDSGDGKVTDTRLHAAIEAIFHHQQIPDDNWVRQVKDTLTLRTGLLVISRLWRPRFRSVRGPGQERGATRTGPCRGRGCPANGS